MKTSLTTINELATIALVGEIPMTIGTGSAEVQPARDNQPG
jgi:hypothetical protein